MFLDLFAPVFLFFAGGMVNDSKLVGLKFFVFVILLRLPMRSAGEALYQEV